MERYVKCENNREGKTTVNCENLVVLDVDIILSKCYNIARYIICSCLYHYLTGIMTRFV